MHACDKHKCKRNDEISQIDFSNFKFFSAEDTSHPFVHRYCHKSSTAIELPPPRICLQKICLLHIPSMVTFMCINSKVIEVRLVIKSESDDTHTFWLRDTLIHRPFEEPLRAVTKMRTSLMICECLARFGHWFVVYFEFATASAATVAWSRECVLVSRMWIQLIYRFLFIFFSFSLNKISSSNFITTLKQSALQTTRCIYRATFTTMLVIRCSRV